MGGTEVSVIVTVPGAGVAPPRPAARPPTLPVTGVALDVLLLLAVLLLAVGGLAVAGARSVSRRT